MSFFNWLKKILTPPSKRKKRKRRWLSSKMKARSKRKFNYLMGKFKKQKGRTPNRSEEGFIIVEASHLTMKTRGKRGHWGRQKVRKYLHNERGRDYRMR